MRPVSHVLRGKTNILKRRKQGQQKVERRMNLDLIVRQKINDVNVEILFVMNDQKLFMV